MLMDTTPSSEKFPMTNANAEQDEAQHNGRFCQRVPQGSNKEALIPENIQSHVVTTARSY